MDFKDWRKARDKPNADPEPPRVNKFHGRRYRDYIEEQIAEARERGEFDNLRGFGKPLRFDDDDFYAGDKALAYGLLKSHGFAPAEIELAKEIRTGSERAEAKLERLRQRGRTLRACRLPPSANEKRAYNSSVEKTAVEYEQTLRELNRKILTLNLTTPDAMHRPLFEVEKLVRRFRESCPLFG
jgi:DnaJ homolog subfamily C member 28